MAIVGSLLWPEPAVGDWYTHDDIAPIRERLWGLLSALSVGLVLNVPAQALAALLLTPAKGAMWTTVGAALIWLGTGFDAVGVGGCPTRDSATRDGRSRRVSRTRAWRRMRHRRAGRGPRACLGLGRPKGGVRRSPGPSLPCETTPMCCPQQFTQRRGVRRCSQRQGTSAVGVPDWTSWSVPVPAGRGGARGASGCAGMWDDVTRPPQACCLGFGRKQDRVDRGLAQGLGGPRGGVTGAAGTSSGRGW